MSEAVAIDLKQMLVSNSSFGPSEIKQVSQAINQDYLQYGVLRESVQELEANEARSPAMAAKLGVCYFLMGKFRLAAHQKLIFFHRLLTCPHGLHHKRLQTTQLHQQQRP